MVSDTHLPNFIIPGQQLYFLQTIPNAKNLSREIPKFLESLSKCGLNRSRKTAEPLNKVESAGSGLAFCIGHSGGSQTHDQTPNFTSVNSGACKTQDLTPIF
jgi:hypothetical protein